MVHRQIDHHGIQCEGGERIDNGSVPVNGEEKKCIKCQSPFVPERRNLLICPTCKDKYSARHERVKCEVCGKMLVAIKNHLKVHKMTTNEYIIMYPGKPLASSTLRDSIVNGRPRMPSVNFCSKCGGRFEHSGRRSLCEACAKREEQDLVECQICHKRLKWITAAHLVKHGITLPEYASKYGETKSPAIEEIFKRNGDGRRTQDILIDRRLEQLEAAGVKPVKNASGTVSHGIFVEKAFKTPLDPNELLEFWRSATSRAVSDDPDAGALWTRGPPREREPPKISIPLPLTERDYRVYNAISGLSDMERLCLLVFKVKYLQLMRKGITP